MGTSLSKILKQFFKAGKQVSSANRTRKSRKSAMKKATTTKQRAKVLRTKF